MGEPWHGVLTLQGVESGDHRILENVTWRDLPLTLRIQTEDFGAHDGASPVGRIDSIELREDGKVYGSGEFSDSPEGVLAAQWVGERVLRGVSVDPGAIEYVEEIVDGATGEPVTMQQVWDAYDELDAASILGDSAEIERIETWLASLYSRIRFTLYEVAAATLVATPAFGEAVIELGVESIEREDDDEDDDEPAMSVRDRLSALIHPHSAGDVAGFGPGRLIAAGDARFAPTPAERLLAALPRARQAAAPARMRSEFFQPLDYAAPSKWTITDEGRIMGHLFTWDACHRSFTGRCERPERQSSFEEFHTGETVLDDGTRMRTGVITFADLHAPDAQLTMEQMQRLMEDTGVQLGPVRLHADRFGVQACGQVFDDVEPTQLSRALAGFPSGDWRRIAGSFRLFGLHVVNTPGFPMYDDDAEPLRLVASLAPVIGPRALAAQASLAASAAPACGCQHDDDSQSDSELDSAHRDERAHLSATALHDLALLDAAVETRRRSRV